MNKFENNGNINQTEFDLHSPEEDHPII